MTDNELKAEVEEYLQEKAELEEEARANAERDAYFEYLDSLSPDAKKEAYEELRII